MIELEPEVREWLDALALKDYAKVEAMADILADQAETLGEPYSRHLSGKTREPRFHFERSAVRISYWLAPGRRVVLLTVFRKTPASRTGRGRPGGRRAANMRGWAWSARAGR